VTAGFARCRPRSVSRPSGSRSTRRVGGRRPDRRPAGPGACDLVVRSEARFADWYVNLEDPWRPWRLGFDTEDHTLDLWVDRDGAWRWKDEDELEIAVDVGFYTPEEAAAFRAEGEAVVAEWPFPTGWESWEPDEAWPLPTLPADWDELP
jgi:uncharacterized protein